MLAVTRRLTAVLPRRYAIRYVESTVTLCGDISVTYDACADDGSKVEDDPATGDGDRSRSRSGSLVHRRHLKLVVLGSVAYVNCRRKRV